MATIVIVEDQPDSLKLLVTLLTLLAFFRRRGWF